MAAVAVEREVFMEVTELSEVSKLIEALNNGQNTREKRLEAVKLIMSGRVTSNETQDLLRLLESAWRKEGKAGKDVVLDTAEFDTPKTS